MSKEWWEEEHELIAKGEQMSECKHKYKSTYDTIKTKGNILNACICNKCGDVKWV